MANNIEEEDMSKVHIVSSGETLSQIARKNGGNWYNPGYRQSLLAANPQIINPHQIRTGLRIVLPSNLTRKVSEIAVKQAKTIRSATQLYDARIDAYKCDPSLSGEKERLWRMLDSSPTFQGMGVAAFKNGGDLVVYRRGHGKRAAFVTPVKAGEEKRLLKERATVINSAILSCVGFGLEAIVVGAGTVATMGATSALGWAALSASGYSCWMNVMSLQFDGIDRIRKEHEWTMYVADAVAVLASAGYSFQSIQALNRMRNASKAQWYDLFFGKLNGSQIKSVSKEVNLILKGNPSGKQYKHLLKNGFIQKRYSNSLLKETSFRHLSTIVSGAFDFAGSAYSGNIQSYNQKLLIGVTGIDNK